MEENYVKGTCQTMCPRKEAQLRQKENLLHKFEMKKGTENQKRPEFDPEKVIKSYNRSAAGVETTNPSNLRPFPVLLKTIHYLYKEIFPIHKDKPVVVYNFMFDRFRAVRQDAVIQNLSSMETIQLLEPIVRFLIYFGYILIEEDISQFDPHINNTHLQECMKRLLVCYDDFETDNKENRWDIESAYLLFNLGNIKPLTRGVKLCQFTKTPSEMYKHCVNLSFQWYLKNYIRLLDMIRKLPLILLCVIVISLPEIRRFILQAMSHGYSASNSAFPISHLRSLLMYESDNQTVEECHHFNIKLTDEKVNFLKKDFDVTVKHKKGVRLKWVDEMITNCELDYYLCHGNK